MPHPASDSASPTLEEVASRFVSRMTSGVAVSAWGRPYSRSTASIYASRLRRHVLPHVDAAASRARGSIPRDLLDAATIQRLVDDIARTHGGTVTLACHAALTAALADAGCEAARGVHLPGPASPGVARAYGVAECRRLVDGARAIDAQRGERFFEPLLALQLGAAVTTNAAIRLRWGHDGVDLDGERGRVVVLRYEAGTIHRLVSMLPSACDRVLREHRAALLDAGADGEHVLPWRGFRLHRADVVYLGLREIADPARLRGFTTVRLRHTALSLNPDKISAAFNRPEDDS